MNSRILTLPALTLALFGSVSAFAIESVRLQLITPMNDKDGKQVTYEASEYDQQLAKMDATLTYIQGDAKAAKDGPMTESVLVVKGLVERCKSLNMPKCPLYMPTMNSGFGSMVEFGDHVYGTAMHVITGLIPSGAFRKEGDRYWIQSAALFHIDREAKTLILDKFFIPPSDGDVGQVAEIFVKSGQANGVKMYKDSGLELTDYALFALDRDLAKQELSEIKLGTPHQKDLIKVDVPILSVDTKSRPLTIVDSDGMQGKIPAFNSYIVVQQDPKHPTFGQGDSGAPYVDSQGRFLGILVGLSPVTGVVIALSFDPKKLAADW